MCHHKFNYKLNRLKNCGIHFGGNPYENVEIFRNDVETYKRNNYISDELALLDLETILYGTALEWWNLKKETFIYWNQAISCLVGKFRNQQ